MVTDVLRATVDYSTLSTRWAKYQLKSNASAIHKRYSTIQVLKGAMKQTLTLSKSNQPDKSATPSIDGYQMHLILRGTKGNNSQLQHSSSYHESTRINSFQSSFKKNRFSIHLLLHHV